MKATQRAQYLVGANSFANRTEGSAVDAQGAASRPFANEFAPTEKQSALAMETTNLA
jgi:hypothetical protein